MLDIMEKKCNVEDIKKALWACFDNNLFSLPTGFMIGMPGENIRTCRESGKLMGEIAAKIKVPLDFIFKHVDISYALPLIGTPLYEYGKQFGLIGSKEEDEEKYLELTSDVAPHKRYFINFNGAPMSEVIFWDILVYLEAMRTYVKLMKNKSHVLVGVIMGSKSDWEGAMQHCSDTLKQFGIKHDVRVISAHRTPKRLHKFLKEAKKNKMEIIIAAAGMSAHLAGVTASLTTLPVLGVPTESKLKGLDSLLSTVQMPAGIPVGTLAIGKAGAINAALLAVSILAIKNKKIENKLIAYRSNFEKKVPKKPF